MKVEEGEFTPGDLYSAREVFITSTIMEVLPVSGIDGKKNFSVGGVTKLLMAEYRKEAASYVRDTKAAGPSIWGFSE